MSGDRTPETETPSKPLLALLEPEASDDDDTPAAFRCSGGSCSIG